MLSHLPAIEIVKCYLINYLYTYLVSIMQKYTDNELKSVQNHHSVYNSSQIYHRKRNNFFYKIIDTTKSYRSYYKFIGSEIEKTSTQSNSHSLLQLIHNNTAKERKKDIYRKMEIKCNKNIFKRFRNDNAFGTLQGGGIKNTHPTHIITLLCIKSSYKIKAGTN